MDQVRLNLSIDAPGSQIKLDGIKQKDAVEIIILELDHQVRVAQKRNANEILSVKVNISKTNTTEEDAAEEVDKTPRSNTGDDENVVVFKNNSWHQGRVLAVVGDRMLIEYCMPDGSTSLAVRLRSTGIDYPMSYLSAPKTLLQDMIVRGRMWIGKPRQYDESIPQPGTKEYWDMRYKTRRNLHGNDRATSTRS